MGYLRKITALTLFIAGLASATSGTVNKRATDGGVSNNMLNKFVKARF
jgi:hypothetical protein